MNNMNIKNIHPFFFLSLLTIMMLFACCHREYTPRPRGYFRIAFPEKSYRDLSMKVPYTFKIPGYSYPEADSLNLDQPDWVTIQIPGNHAQIHISYIRLNNNLADHSEFSRSLAYKHTEKASSIEEQIFINRAKKVYGTLYTIKGDAASPMQFYLTDSVSNFLRGALYIKEVPNADSLRPVINFLSQDVLRIVESTEWKNSK
jgi:gliding motility-associated lipoprotein GldD